MKKILAAFLLTLSLGAQAEIHYTEFGWYDDCLGTTASSDGDLHSDLLYQDNHHFHNGRIYTDEEIVMINSNMMWADDEEYQALNMPR